MLMIRFQPRRVSNVVAGLTIFWCAILSILFWIQGHNLNFLILMLVIVVIGFLMGSAKTDAYQKNILKRLGFLASRRLPITSIGAFSTVSQGVFSSIGPIPFQYPLPARLTSAQLQTGSFSSLIQSRFPIEVLSSGSFAADFITAIDSGPHAQLIRAILEVYCHPDHINLPAGITRHNGELLLTHCLRVAALMYHRANEFSSKNFYISLNNQDHKIDRDDDLLIVAALAHDLGKVNSFIKDASGTVTGIRQNHHKSSCRAVSSLPEFWSTDLSREDRYIIQSNCIYSTEYAASPIQSTILDQSKPKALLDRLQLLIELTIECDTLASQIENGIKYQFNAPSKPLHIFENQNPSELLEETKFDLFLKFSEFISTSAIINGKGTDRSVAFKYLDTSGKNLKHFIFIDEVEFNISFAMFLNRPEWAEKDNKSHALAFAVLPKLDDAGYLVKSVDIGVQPAINCLYKVDFIDEETKAVTHSLRSCFVLDMTDWPNQNKIREMISCKSKPIIINSIFGNKFIAVRRSVTDSDVYEALGIADTTRSATSNIESFITSNKTRKTEQKQLNSHAIIGRIKSALTKQLIVPVRVTEENGPIPIADADDFFVTIGVKMIACDHANDDMKAIGVMSIRNSKTRPGTHIVLLDPNIYVIKTSV